MYISFLSDGRVLTHVCTSVCVFLLPNLFCIYFLGMNFSNKVNLLTHIFQIFCDRALDRIHALGS